MNYSDKQIRIFEEYENTTNNLTIEAAPGSGKTFTLTELLKRTPKHYKSIFLAFNKSIQQELEKKVPEGTDALTLHSLGFRALLKHTNNKYKLTEIKNWIIGKQILNLNGFKDEKKKNVYLFIVSKLVDLYRLNVCKTKQDLQSVADKYNVSYINGEIDDTLKIIEYLEKYNRKEYRDRNKPMMIDFVDMIYLPTVILSDEQFPKYDIVMVDECLPYSIPVLLSDGTSLPIGKIVEEKLPVEVYTYNEQTKTQEFCKVTNWSRSFNDKKMYKIQGHNKYNHNIRSFVVCTYNHKIFTKECGFICSEEVKPGMHIQFETKAEKTQKYKITCKGSKTLQEIMNKKNSDPEYKLKTKNKTEKIGRNLKKNQKNRGGNGITNELQQLFLKDLKIIDNDWKSELCIKTEMGHLNGIYPNNYKVDLGHPKFKIAIELDGNSHNNPAQRERDEKKDNLLKSKGWIIKRIKNIDLVKNYNNILSHIKGNDFNFCYDGVHCMVDLIVDSVEEISTKEKWVYDITVEKNHNFYANGVLVHNCQDLNALQWKLIQNLFRKRTRFVCVGDKFQSIYSFQGADRDVFDSIKQYPKTTVLPLSYSYRCPKKVVEEANKVFNFIESPDWKEDGEIVYDGNFNEVKEGDFILCRNNSPLIETFLFLIKKGKRCKILGRDLGNGLLNVLNKIEDFSKESKDELLKNKREQLKEKGVVNVTNNASYNELIERIFILEELHKEFQDISVLKSTIEDMFADERNLSTKDFIVLSTIHRSKGLESDCVYFLYENLLPSKYAESELELYSEDCLRYVCITRAKKKLIYVDSIK